MLRHDGSPSRGIAADQDGALWFTDIEACTIRLDPPPSVADFVRPGRGAGRSPAVASAKARAAAQLGNA